MELPADRGCSRSHEVPVPRRGSGNPGWELGDASGRPYSKRPVLQAYGRQVEPGHFSGEADTSPGIPSGNINLVVMQLKMLIIFLGWNYLFLDGLGRTST